MIIYDNLWETMQEKGFTQYKLIKQYNFSRGQISRLKKNQNISTYTINRLCNILDCEVEDIITFIKD